MNRVSRRLMAVWASQGPRFFPFADVATPDLPLRRLLRLSLFQASCGMALVLLVGTLNRVMIVELGVAASLVGVMLAMPVAFAPFRALVGFRSDTHRCALGWRRVPFIWNGTLLTFAGFSIMPFALLVLAGEGEAAHAPGWVGPLAAALAFGLAGAGVHTVQTAGLALATDLTPASSHPRVVGLMYVSLLVGMMVSALVFGGLLVDFTPGRLVQVIQGAAVATVMLNTVALWKQETRRPPRGAPEPARDPSFREAWAKFCEGEHARRRLIIVGIGTLGFGMAEILIEPFGGEVLTLSVSSTTRLTALLAAGGLLGFAFASYVLGRGGDAFRLARDGALIGLPAFALVIASAPLNAVGLFLVGNFLVGFGGALFGHGTLTASMNRAPADQVGLALGAWGAVQATAAGVGVALGGVIRDLVALMLGEDGRVFGFGGTAGGYLAVYALEIILLAIAVAATLPLLARAGRGESTGGTAGLIGPAAATPEPQGSAR